MIYLASPCPAFPPSATNSQTVAEYCTGEGKDRGQIQGTFPVRPETEVSKGLINIRCPVCGFLGLASNSVKWSIIQF